MRSSPILGTEEWHDEQSECRDCGHGAVNQGLDRDSVCVHVGTNSAGRAQSDGKLACSAPPAASSV